jgi:hypothetical protein
MADRVIVYQGETPLSTDFLSSEKNYMIALAMLAKAILGTSTQFDGLACTPTAPPSLEVSISAGSCYSLQNVDSTAYSGLGSDTTHQILKQGISLDPVLLTCTAPTTTGNSINYLVQAQYQDQDTGSITLPYYNSTNPQQAYAGPANSGTSQNTIRKGAIVFQLKAGASAATGSQTTPTPDAGYTGLYVVTVANGATTITSPNISLYPGAPFITNKLGGTTGVVQLTGATTYYVNSSSGSDSNSGTSSGSAWQTLQHAGSWIQDNVDNAGFNVTVQFAAGTDTGGININGPFLGSGTVTFVGDTGTPTNCVISTTGKDAVLASNGASFNIIGFHITTTTSGGAIHALNNSTINFGTMDFGGCHDSHVTAQGSGASIGGSTSYTVSGSSVGGSHFTAQFNATIDIENFAINLTGTPHFPNGFAYCDGAYLHIPGMSYTGSATGQRYDAFNGGAISTNGGGSNYFPGDSAGTSTTGYYS